MKKYFLITFIILSGIFYYKTILPGQFEQSQFAFFIFFGGILGSIILYKENKWLGLIAGLGSFSFFKSYLFLLGSREELYKVTLIGIFILLIYYAIKKLNIKKDILKWFLIPAILNMILVLMQAFDHTSYFMQVSQITGFLGMTGKVGCYLLLSLPLFLEYLPWMFPVLLLVFMLCKSSLILSSFFILTFIWLFLKKKTTIYFIILLLILASVTSIIVYTNIPWNKGDIPQRICFWLGTLDGIKHNPILGWGIGNFENIWAQILSSDTKYFLGYYCNYGSLATNDLSIMNHPHNEFLLWWWFMGIGMPILFIGLCWEIFRKKNKDISLSLILIAGFTVIMFYFLSLPAWILLTTALAIYEKEAQNG